MRVRIRFMYSTSASILGTACTYIYMHKLLGSSFKARLRVVQGFSSLMIQMLVPWTAVARHQKSRTLAATCYDHRAKHAADHTWTTIGGRGWMAGVAGEGDCRSETILIRGMEYPWRATPGESLVRDRRNSYLHISRGDQISKLNLERIYCLQISGEASTLLCIFEDVRLAISSSPDNALDFIGQSRISVRSLRTARPFSIPVVENSIWVTNLLRVRWRSNLLKLIGFPPSGRIYWPRLNLWSDRETSFGQPDAERHDCSPSDRARDMIRSDQLAPSTSDRRYMNNRSSKSGCLRDIAREISDGYPDDRLLDTAVTAGSNVLTIGYIRWRFDHTDQVEVGAFMTMKVTAVTL